MDPYYFFFGEKGTKQFLNKAALMLKSNTNSVVSPDNSQAICVQVCS